MEFQEVVRRRRMVRTFTGEPVPAETLARILGNAVRGPSAGFSQGQSFLVLADAADRSKFWDVAGVAVPSSAQTAPLVIVPMSCKRVYLDRYAQADKGWTDKDESRWPVPFWHIDTGMAALLILLTVVDEGLGALYFGIVTYATAESRTVRRRLDFKLTLADGSIYPETGRLYAVNREYVERDHQLADGDEVALIPPVSGGSFRLVEGPLDVAAVLREVEDPEAGAVASFVGTVRRR